MDRVSVCIRNDVVLPIIDLRYKLVYTLDLY